MRKKYLLVKMQRYPFDSARKRMSTILEIPLDEKTENNHPRRIHTKGASEIVL